MVKYLDAIIQMKIIHRSILKELILAFVLGLASLNFIIMMEKLVRLSRLLSGVGTSMLDMVRLILLLQPQLFLLTIPMALLLSTLIVYGRLNMDNEIVILRTSGMNFIELSRPVLILGMLCFALNLLVGVYIGPKSSLQLRHEIANILRERTPAAMEEGSFNTFFKNIVIYVNHKSDDNEIRGIFMFDNRNKNEPRILTAKEGRITAQEGFALSLSLRDGVIQISKGMRTTDLFFKKYNMILQIESDAPSRKNSEMTPWELVDKISQSSRHEAKFFYLELYRRFSFPFMCIIIIFLGPPLALIAGKSGKLGGLTIGLSTFTAYYILLVYGENLVRAGKIAHYLGAWGATLILSIAAIWIFRRENAR
ncbi:MAG TPA: LptF/LptG family permease [Thermodesulfovibrionales bacterium]|nr:LptF/LptG family permease [Thermodesulfovibrionales bacterium]